MKRLATAALAAVMFAAPLAYASAASADDDRDDRGWRHGYHDDDDDRWDRREARRAYREGYRDGRRHERWDARRHNGYWDDGRWYYGPPRHYAQHYRYDYRPWRRGEVLPPYYRSHYHAVDWRYHRLRPPPRGYHYVYDDDREEYLLVGIATGVILGVILSGH
ncbi:MAG: RcnB family protein [Hyphomonadaceae bacterium]|nr:RcnB family protein [Hyphomonadaceae bacterium]